MYNLVTRVPLPSFKLAAVAEMFPRRQSEISASTSRSVYGLRGEWATDAPECQGRLDRDRSLDGSR